MVQFVVNFIRLWFWCDLIVSVFQYVMVSNCFWLKHIFTFIQYLYMTVRLSDWGDDIITVELKNKLYVNIEISIPEKSKTSTSHPTPVTKTSFWVSFQAFCLTVRHSFMSNYYRKLFFFLPTDIMWRKCIPIRRWSRNWLSVRWAPPTRAGMYAWQKTHWANTKPPWNWRLKVFLRNTLHFLYNLSRPSFRNRT